MEEKARDPPVQALGAHGWLMDDQEVQTLRSLGLPHL